MPLYHFPIAVAIVSEKIGVDEIERGYIPRSIRHNADNNSSVIQGPCGKNVPRYCFRKIRLDRPVIPHSGISGECTCRWHAEPRKRTRVAERGKEPARAPSAVIAVSATRYAVAIVGDIGVDTWRKILRAGVVGVP